MEKQDLINYCTCRDFDYINVLHIAKLSKSYDVPTEAEYIEERDKFNRDMEAYFKDAHMSGTDERVYDFPFTDAELG